MPSRHLDLVGQYEYVYKHNTFNQLSYVSDLYKEYDCEENTPCTADYRADEMYHFNHADPTKFVQCDHVDGCFIRPCQPGTVFGPTVSVCVHM